MLTDETFSPEEEAILSNYVSNTSKTTFVLYNLPEVMKGALFSRYSRSRLGLRSLLLKEFLQSEETDWSNVAVSNSHLQPLESIKKAQRFYDRVLDGYGDDSIAELGGAHLALENVSILASKTIEDCRIGGSPLEKSTRYVYFDQQVNGEYRFYQEPILMTSAYRDLYLDTCRRLFTCYTKLVPLLTKRMEERFPREEETSTAAYTATLRAKVLDCLRGLLPASALTNIGLYGNGRFFEGLIRRLQQSPLIELQETGTEAFEELNQAIPSFIRQADKSHAHYLAHVEHQQAMTGALKQLAKRYSSDMAACDTGQVNSSEQTNVRLLSYDPKAVSRVASALLFPHCHSSLEKLQWYCQSLQEEECELILEAATSGRSNRRHKLPRALEHASFTFEFLVDFGAYRDLQRHRMLTQERQLLSCDYGYYIPEELMGTSLEAPYRQVLEEAKKAYDHIAVEFREEAQYVVPMAYRLRWYFHITLRELQWLTELRSASAGHPVYRQVAQKMVKEVCQVFPAFSRFFSFVDWSDATSGRLEAEKRAEKQREKRK